MGGLWGSLATGDDDSVGGYWASEAAVVTADGRAAQVGGEAKLGISCWWRGGEETAWTLDNNLEPSSRKGRDGPPPSVIHSPLHARVDPSQDSTQDPCRRRVPATTPWLRSPSPSFPSLSVFFISSSTGKRSRSAINPPRCRSLAGDLKNGLSCAGREIRIAMGQVGKSTDGC